MPKYRTIRVLTHQMNHFLHLLQDFIAERNIGFYKIVRGGPFKRYSHYSIHEYRLEKNGILKKVSGGLLQIRSQRKAQELAQQWSNETNRIILDSYEKRIDNLPQEDMGKVMRHIIEQISGEASK